MKLFIIMNHQTITIIVIYCNIEIKFKKQIENARKTYDLGNISDKELNEALIKTNGKIDEAVFELFKN